MGPQIRIGNKNHHVPPLLVGGDVAPRLGLLLGITKGHTTLELEIEKAQACLPIGISTITDLTTIPASPLRSWLLRHTESIIGTVPTYEIYAHWKRGHENARSSLFRILEAQAKQGVDFFSLHPSFTHELADQVAGDSGRIKRVTSRGGAMLAELMRTTGGENPFFEYWPEILDMCREFGITLSLVGTLRPGSIVDAFETLHFRELEIQSQLAIQARERGVPTMIELLNHVPLSQVPKYMALAEKLFDGSPVGALGPSPTDIGIGFDDVVGAIGAAVATWHGAAWVNCVTAAEHTHIPLLSETIRAVEYFALALHIGRVASSGMLDRDAALSKARAENSWSRMTQLSLFPHIAEKVVNQLGYKDGNSCTMCGTECPLVRIRAVTKNQLGA